MKNKAHLTKEGLEHIQLIKAGMNKGRKPAQAPVTLGLVADNR
jgi:hypothetical protein